MAEPLNKDLDENPEHDKSSVARREMFDMSEH